MLEGQRTADVMMHIESTCCCVTASLCAVCPVRCVVGPDPFGGHFASLSEASQAARVLTVECHLLRFVVKRHLQNDVLATRLHQMASGSLPSRQPPCPHSQTMHLSVLAAF